MGFWIRNAILAIVLIGLAVAFYLNMDLLLALDTKNQEISTSEAETKKDDATHTPPPSEKKNTNAAADGLSKFYGKIYGDNKKNRKVRNNIIFLPEPQGDLVQILQAREMIVRPFPKNWSGTKASRAFRTGETLLQKLVEYSESDGLEVIWWVNRDFIIKDPFRINMNILKTASQVGKAVAGNFPEGINSYFCYRQRTLVFVNEPLTYLNEECTLLK